MTHGYNPLRWDCAKSGCFNVKRRPKLEMFSDCFPGSINFGDVDAIVEICGSALLLEWKSAPMAISGGQRIMYQKLTSDGTISVIAAAGDAETMSVSHKGFFYRGKWTGWQDCDFAGLKSSIAKWATWAREPKDAAE